MRRTGGNVAGWHAGRDRRGASADGDSGCRPTDGPRPMRERAQPEPGHGAVGVAIRGRPARQDSLNPAQRGADRRIHPLLQRQTSRWRPSNFFTIAGRMWRRSVTSSQSFARVDLVGDRVEAFRLHVTAPLSPALGEPLHRMLSSRARSIAHSRLSQSISRRISPPLDEKRLFHDQDRFGDKLGRP